MEAEPGPSGLQPIFDANELAELTKVHQTRMNVFNKNQLIIETLKLIDFNAFDELTDENKSNIERNIDYLYYMDYVQFDPETGKSPTGKQ